MSFTWFKKHEKMFLWATVVFSVLIFATFSGFGDLEALIAGRGAGDVIGEFTVASTGAVRQVSFDEFHRVRTGLNRISQASRREPVEDDDVWAHLMLAEDARAAGLVVTDQELAQAMTGGQPVSRAQYDQHWRDRLQFSSAREFEQLMRDTILGARWQQYSAQSERIVSAEDVYARWRVDNELFDYEALLVADLPLEEVADPDEATLQAWWDGLNPGMRAQQYAESARVDLVAAWLAFSDEHPEELLAAEPEPSAAEIDARFSSLQRTRYEGVEAADDAIRATLARELRLGAIVQRTLGAFQERPEAERTKEAFIEQMGAAGLTVRDVEGGLDREGLIALEPIGDDLLPLFLERQPPGGTHLGYPAGDPRAAYAVFVESVQPSRPQTLEEAQAAAVANWKEEQRSRPAREFREALREATRALPEVAELVAPILESAEQRVEAALAAQPELDEAARAELAAGIREEAEELEIRSRLAEFEHLAWATIARPEGSELRVFQGVSRGYARLDEGEEPEDGLTRFLKTNGQIFRMSVGTITEPLRHAASGQTAVVHVTGRRFPEMAAMFDDAEGLANARRSLSTQREQAAHERFSPENLKLSHGLKIAVPEEPATN